MIPPLIPSFEIETRYSRSLAFETKAGWVIARKSSIKGQPPMRWVLVEFGSTLMAPAPGTKGEALRPLMCEVKVGKVIGKTIRKDSKLVKELIASLSLIEAMRLSV